MHAVTHPSPTPVTWSNMNDTNSGDTGLLLTVFDFGSTACTCGALSGQAGHFDLHTRLALSPGPEKSGARLHNYAYHLCTYTMQFMRNE